MKILTEQLPSSGSNAHNHDWQKISEDATTITMVCRHEECRATKCCPKPKLQESQGGKQLILG